ncbi:MAG: hypothetical protein GY929_00725 [Actinomycetia bacterium]|nr:hypothetical protein [Actinomycetes bacterium]
MSERREPARPADLPSGTLDLAAHYLAEASQQLRRLTRARLPSDPDWVRHQVMLPLDVDETWPHSTPPRPIGTGAVHADLIDDDAEALDHLIDTTGPDPEQVASDAQQLRLPVTPYRTDPHPVFDIVPDDLTVLRRRTIRKLRILDLTSLWAGPLATALLAAAGTEVIKIDAAIRPDGFHDRPELFRALNAGKIVRDLDLRDIDDRDQFEKLVADCDLVIDSFSRRVMGNLGYSPDELRQIKGDIATLSITAFPGHVPERDWVSYGPGIHAVSGLGMASGEPLPPPVAYPDPLTGIRAFGVALGLLGRTDERPHVELSLLGSVAPLVEQLRGGAP